MEKLKSSYFTNSDYVYQYYPHSSNWGTNDESIDRYINEHLGT